MVDRFYIVSLDVQQFQLEEEKFVLYDSCHRRSFHDKSSTFITKFTSNPPKGRKKRKLTREIPTFPTRNAPDSSREEEEEKVHFPTSRNKIATNSQNEEFRPDPLKK